MNPRFRLAAGMTALLIIIGIAVVLLTNRLAAHGVAEASTALAPRVNAATFRADSISISTYAYTPALQIRSTGPYTYHWLNWSDYDPSVIVPVTYTLLVLENDYLSFPLAVPRRHGFFPPGQLARVAGLFRISSRRGGFHWRV